MYDYVFRLLLLGESSVGKTTILNQYLGHGFRESLSTIGVEFHPKVVNVLHKKVKLVIYDTSGQERYKAIVSNYYRNTHGIIFVYDITKKDSLRLVEYWLEQAKEKGGVDMRCCVLFGNKTDLDMKRSVSYDEGELFARKYGLGFMEGNALKGVNINECFGEIAKKILVKIQQENESFNDSLQLDNIIDNNNNKKVKLYKFESKDDKVKTKKKTCC